MRVPAMRGLPIITLAFDTINGSFIRCLLAPLYTRSTAAFKRLKLEPQSAASPAPRRRPARIALAARPAADQRQLAAFAARVAFVAFEAGQADLLALRGAGDDVLDGDFGAVAVAGLVAVAVAVAVFRQRA